MLDGIIGRSPLAADAAFKVGATVKDLVITDIKGTNLTKAGKVAFKTGNVDAAGKFTAGTAATDKHLQLSFTADNGDVTNVVLALDDMIKVNGSKPTTALTAKSKFTIGDLVTIDLTSVGLGTISTIATAASTELNEVFTTLATTVGAIAPPAGANTTLGGELSLQVGDTGDDYQKVTVSISNLSSKALYLKNINLSTDPNDCLTKVKAVIKTVSKQRVFI